MLQLHMAVALIFVSLVFELTVEKDQLSQEARQEWNSGYHSLLSPGFSSYPFINYPEKKDEELGVLHEDSPGWDSNSGLRIHS